MTICSFCQGTIFSVDEIELVNNPHHLEAASWRESVLANCSICTLLLERVRGLLQSDSGTTEDIPRLIDCLANAPSFPIYEFTISLRSVLNGYNLCFKPSQAFQHLRDARSGPRREEDGETNTHSPMRPLKKELLENVTSLKQSFFCYEAEDNDFQLAACPLETNTFSETTTAQIKAWVDLCQTRHNCRKGDNDRSSWPNRLLDVSNSSLKDDTVRIVEKPDFPPSLRYTTLSHCWGPKPMPVTLTTHNYDELRSGIPLSALPANFREAVVVTRKLDVSYIWIDSLCIIQAGDEKRDWYREGCRMADYYCNAFCNIAATNSKGPDGGLARQRDLDNLMPVPVESNWDDQSRTLMVVRDDFWEGEVLVEPLYQRSWVFQGSYSILPSLGRASVSQSLTFLKERMLASRMVHFGKNQVFWQCSDLTACETFPGGLPTSTVLTSTKESAWRRLFQRTEQPTSAWRTGESPRALWRMFVEQYSRCNLTFASDKLVAIASVAKQVQKQLGDRYVAGSWWSTLRQDLPWQLESTRAIGAKPEPEIYRAPSWAWPSVDGVVKMPTQQVWSAEDWMVEIKDVHLEPKDKDNEYGELVPGSFLSMLAYLYQVPFELDPKSGLRIWKRNEAASTQNEMTLRLDRQTADWRGTEETFTLLLLVAGVNNTQFTGKALAVQQESLGKFRRLGLVDIHSASTRFWEELEKVRITTAQSAGSVLCDSAGKHVLDLI